MTNLQAFV